MNDLWNDLALSGRPVALYGTGNGADKVMNELEKRGISVCAMFASDGFVRERYFRGFRVLSFSEFYERFPGVPVLMCFGSSRPEVLENVKKIASVCEFYAPDVPVYGEGVFDSAFHDSHRAELEQVREKLSDEASRLCFDCHVNYKLSGDISFLERCAVPREAIENEFFRASGHSFLDLGAYTGDTALVFDRLNPVRGKIIAVEPDKRNFRKLISNTAEFDDIYHVNAACSDRDGTVSFDYSKGRGAHISENGEKTVSRSVDGLVGEYGIDCGKLFIKADVEGNELDVINGAQNTVRKYAPGLCIACYHRNEDLFSLPLRVLKLYPDYKVYMRHSPHIPAWDTEYYFIR